MAYFEIKLQHLVSGKSVKETIVQKDVDLLAVTTDTYNRNDLLVDIEVISVKKVPVVQVQYLSHQDDSSWYEVTITFEGEEKPFSEKWLVRADSTKDIDDNISVSSVIPWELSSIIKKKIDKVIE